jgi:hypothetical protein
MVPTLDIAGLTIAEPMTTFTDYLITVFATVFAVRLVKRFDRSRHHAHWLWGLAFLFIGVAALLGGTSHGFVGYLADPALRTIWEGTVYSVGLSMIFAVAGSVEGSGLDGLHRKILHGLNLVAFAVYAIWMTSNADFIYVISYYVPAMSTVALIQLWGYYRTKLPAAPWFVAGVTVTLLGAVIQQSGFSLHRHFNHNDIYHVVQIAGLWLLFRGAALIRR